MSSVRSLRSCRAAPSGFPASSFRRRQPLQQPIFSSVLAASRIVVHSIVSAWRRRETCFGWENHAASRAISRSIVRHIEAGQTQAASRIARGAGKKRYALRDSGSACPKEPWPGCSRTRPAWPRRCPCHRCVRPAARCSVSSARHRCRGLRPCDRSLEQGMERSPPRCSRKSLKAVSTSSHDSAGGGARSPGFRAGTESCRDPARRAGRDAANTGNRGRCLWRTASPCLSSLLDNSSSLWATSGRSPVAEERFRGVAGTADMFEMEFRATEDHLLHGGGREAGEAGALPIEEIEERPIPIRAT